MTKATTCRNQTSRPLPETHPDLATEYAADLNDHPVFEVSFGQQHKVFWRCIPAGHTWRASPNSRQQGSGCPYCSGRLPTPGVNDLATTHPEIAAEMDPVRSFPITPQTISAGSARKPWWTCPAGHFYDAAVVSRVRGGGCPYCSGRRVLAGVNDAATTHPHLVAEFDEKASGFSLAEVVAGSCRKGSWKCQLGHTWTAQVAKRKRGGGCPYCSGRKVWPGFNDLATVDPFLAGQLDEKRSGFTASEVTYGSGRRGYWKCEHGHTWDALVGQRHLGSRCPYCYAGCSAAEADLKVFLEDLLGDHEVESRYRKIPGVTEVDLYVPGHDVAVEFNGVYWHSEKNPRIHKNYHRNKWLACKDAGVRLITVWEDDWRDSPEIVKSLLRHKLGVSAGDRVGARSCTVITVDNEMARLFLDTHHLQGWCRASVFFGLDHPDYGLVALSGWRRDGDTAYLDRYATSAVVPGGMGRLLAAGRRWARENGCTRIVTFADHCVSDGDLYDKLGFTADKELYPDYSYLVKNSRAHKFGYRRKRFRDDPDLIYDPALTERELAEVNGLARIWDCGKTRYVLPVDPPPTTDPSHPGRMDRPTETTRRRSPCR